MRIQFVRQNSVSNTRVLMAIDELSLFKVDCKLKIALKLYTSLLKHLLF